MIFGGQLIMQDYVHQEFVYGDGDLEVVNKYTVVERKHHEKRLLVKSIHCKTREGLEDERKKEYRGVLSRSSERD